MRVKDDLDLYYESLEALLVKNEKENAFPEYFYNSFLAGKNSVYRKELSEVKVFDEEWISTLESYFPSIDKILRNPTSAIRYENEVVDVERAKRVTSESVRHLAANSHFIREVNEQGVVPRRILTTFTEQEFGTYENRFLVSLIFRLVSFVETRYKVIKENVESFLKDHVNMNSTFEIEGTEVKLDIDMVIKKDVDETTNIHNRQLLARIEKLYEMITGFRSSQLVRDLEKTKRVNPPIIKTNIILKNPDFRNCYTLWLFIDKYSNLFYDVKVKEKTIGIGEDFSTSVSRLALMTYTMVQSKAEERSEKFENVNEYELRRKKLIKVKDIHPDDVLDRPEPIKVEDDTVKEYFLNQYRNTFNKKLDENKRNSSSYDVALRRTLREVIAISNSLFDAVFDVEGSEDIFKRLVDKENPSEDFERAKNKFQVSKVIRETKEVDYQSAIRLEKRLLKEMEKANNKLIRENIKARSSETRKTYLAKLERQMRLYQKEKIKIKDQLTAITDKKGVVVKEKKRLQRELKGLSEKTKKQKLAFEKAEKTRLETQLKKIEERKRARVKKVLVNKLAKEKAAKERLAKKLAKEKEKAALALQAFKEKQKAKSKEKISKAKAKSEEKIKAIEQLSTTSEFVNTPEVKDDNNA
jgi:exonuclease SbcC